MEDSVARRDQRALLARYHFLQREIQHAADLREDLVERASGKRSARRAITLSRFNPYVDPQGIPPLREAVREGENDHILQILAEEEWIPTFADFLLQKYRFELDDVLLLLKVHEIYEQGNESLRRRFSAGALIAIAVTAGGFIASQTPKETIDALGWDYAVYRGIVFLALILWLAYLVYWRHNQQRGYDRMRRDERLCAAVLVHFEASLTRQAAR